jgi:hypothetical protein
MVSFSEVCSAGTQNNIALNIHKCIYKLIFRLSSHIFTHKINNVSTKTILLLYPLNIMSEINTTKAASNIRRRIKSSKHFEGFKLRVFETSRQTKCFRTVCSFERSPIDINFSTYSYNPNSLISFQFFKQSQFQNQYEYNSRNWITSMNSLQGLFGFTNTYYKTGNVNTQLLFGTYKDNFPQNNYNLYYNYTYDNSNRLLNAINTNQGDMSFSVLNTYDKDGNITTLKRYGDNNNCN